MATNPTLLAMPLAENGTKNVIPETQATAGDGLFSQSTGFPAETSLPLGAGGVAPSREDFNGMANLLGGVAYYAQKGWQFQFDAGQEYFAGCIVRDTTDDKLYECINDVAAGGSVPSADSVNWKPFKELGQLYLRKNSTAYAVGDIAYNENLPSYMHLLCTTAGTTDSTEPDFTGAQIGGTISDGAVVWTYAAFADRSHTVISNYYDNATGDWYRVYADGWVEQGGKVLNGLNYDITFLKPMADTNYTIVAQVASSASAYVAAGLLSTTGARVTSNPSVTRIDWFVAGMGA